MSYPKFAVGEDVLIVSVRHPEINGSQATIGSRKYYATYISSDGTDLGSSYGYVVIPDPTNNPKGSIWHESSLRKRPSDFTFNELMDSLKAPVPVGG